MTIALLQIIIMEVNVGVVKSNVREFRNRAGWTQRKLADEVGRSQQMVQRWEKGRIPDKASMKRLTVAFGCESNDLYPTI